MKQRISFKAVIIIVLIFVTVFLPNSFDLALLLTVGGIHFRFVNLFAFGVALILLVRSARTRQLKWPGRIRGFSLAVFIIFGAIVLSEAYLITMEGVNIRPLIQDTFPVVVPILLAWVLHLDGWRQKDVQWMIRLFIVCAVITTAIDILLILNFRPLYSLFGWKMGNSVFSARPNQAIGTAIAIAGLLSLAMPVALHVQKAGRSLIGRLAYFLCPWFILMGIALQASRLAAATVLLFLFLTTGTAKKGRALRVAALASLFILIFVGYSFVGYFFERYTVLRNASTATRAQAAVVGMRIFADHPVLGTGIGIVYPRAQATILASATVDVKGLGEKIMVYKEWATLPDPHDVYIMWLAEIGLAGAIGLLILFWVVIRYGRRVMREARATGVDDTLFRSAVWSLVLICVQMLGASFLLNNNRIAILIWIWLAVTLEIGRRTLATVKTRRMAVAAAIQQQRLAQAQGDRQYVA